MAGSRSGSESAPAAEPFADVFERARGGEPEAIEQLYRRYGGAVRGFVRRRLSRLLRRKYDSMDLMHSVFAEVLREMPRLEDRGEGGFIQLLRVKSESKVRTKLRRHLGENGKRREVRLVTDHERSRTVPAEESNLIAMDESAKLRLMLGSVNSVTRRILEMHADGNSFAEIAAAAGLKSADAARKRHARALAELRRGWERGGEFDPSCKPRRT